MAEYSRRRAIISSVQRAADTAITVFWCWRRIPFRRRWILPIRPFDLADKYRNPVLILGDGMIGQMMEPVVMPPEKTEFEEKPWAATGRFGQGRRIINSLYIDPAELEQVNLRLQRKYETIAANETRCEEYMTEDADIIIAAYGTTARIAKKSIKELRARGIKAGLLRP